jgi:phosphoesterase RecJ-like protein
VVASTERGGPLVAADYAPARAFLAGKRRLWLPLHVSPDGDCLGCSLALAHMLNQHGHECTVVSADPIPAIYSVFVPQARTALDRMFIGATPPGPPPDAIVALDCSDPARLGAVYTANKALFERLPILNIDHHSTNLRFGDVNILDTTTAAAAEQVAILLDALELPPDEAAANWLLLGLVTDTLGFRTSGTTPRSLRIGAALMEAGGTLYPIVEQAFHTRPLSTVLLWSHALTGVRTDGRTIWVTVSRQMLQESGAKEEELEGLVSWLAGVDTIKVAALLKERGDGTRVSLRSRPGVNVASIAARFGGGGHPQAAGCTIPALGEAAERDLLAAIEQELGPIAG